MKPTSFTSVAKVEINSEVTKIDNNINTEASFDFNFIGDFLYESISNPINQPLVNSKRMNLTELNGSATSVLKNIVIEATLSTKY